MTPAPPATTALPRRRLIALATATLAAGAAGWPLMARAQADWRRIAVPNYDPRDFVTGYLRAHALPRARAWQQACAQLEAALAAAAPGQTASARPAWRAAASTWSALAAVATGPLITRRSARRVDFQPVRVPLIERAIAQAPEGEAAMETVGSPAKGLGALEWLLWAPEAPRDAAAQRYALELARDLRREADAVADDFAQAAAREDEDDEPVVRWFGEILNQWIGALENLRLQRLLRPVEEATSRGQREPQWLRPWARSDADERAARWQAIRDLGAFAGTEAPPRAQGQLVPLESYLRGRGLNPLADRLRGSLLQAGRGVAAARNGQPSALRQAAQAVGRVKHLAEADLAPALDVRVGFSDADGD